ncbi:hypothetical protein [Achromobacter aloeverae]
MLNLNALFFTTDEAQPSLLGNLSLNESDREEFQAAKNDVRQALKQGIPRVYEAEGYPGTALESPRVS